MHTLGLQILPFDIACWSDPDVAGGPKSVPWLADIFKQKIVRGGELEELGPLQPIIAGLLRMRPEDRLSAREALQLFKDTIKE